MDVVDELQRTAHTFLFTRDQQQNYTERRTLAREQMLEWLLGNTEDDRFEVDDKGNRYYVFPEPLEVGGVRYSAIKAQRNTYSEIDLGATEHFMRRLGQDYFDRIFKIVTVRQFQEDELYLMNQEGLIDDEELDSLLIEKENFSLVVVKA